ncbi:hypothetical protein COV16_07050 [Candidatus Woesearchaeota archaeon CG10_big_fil_rev_8_21_14_0_10_34_8]|nr:MAG: hypothetical protein COV16_07050 [Candidatus Woesearchaeota archaeon CG10_big_fil_rev_8_21_14_0_10_34_8]
MEPWYKQLGFKENPLDARPNSTLVGLEEQEEQLKTFIVKEQLCFLHGLTGAGKTSLLKKVQESLPGHTFIYLDADAIPTDFDLTGAIKGKRSFLDRIRMRELPEKKPVLIIDEFQATDPRLVLEARSRWENPTERHVKSIVIAQISEQLKNVPGSFKDRLGNRMIHINSLDNESMNKVLQKRLCNNKTKRDYYEQLSPKTVEFLIAVSDGNARRLLEFTEMLFEYHYQRFKDSNPLKHKPDYKIQFPAAKEILTINNIAVEGYSEEIEEKLQKKNPKEVKKTEKNAAEKIEDMKIEENTIEEKETIIEKAEERISQNFDKEFTIAEQNILRALLRRDRMSLKQIATNIHLEINKCNGVLANLKKKGAIVHAGKMQGDKTWQITQSAKRAMVTK